MIKPILSLICLYRVVQVPQAEADKSFEVFQLQLVLLPGETVIVYLSPVNCRKRRM